MGSLFTRLQTEQVPPVQQPRQQPGQQPGQPLLNTGGKRKNRTKKSKKLKPKRNRNKTY